MRTDVLLPSSDTQLGNLFLVLDETSSVNGWMTARQIADLIKTLPKTVSARVMELNRVLKGTSWRVVYKDVGTPNGRVRRCYRMEVYDPRKPNRGYPAGTRER